MLSSANIRFDFPVKDLKRAKKFYAQSLGLICNYENDYCAQYRYGKSYFVLTPSESAGKAEHSLLTWLVEDIQSVKAWLEKQGVVFESYDFKAAKTENEIVKLGNDFIAWFKDSEGNLLAIAQIES